MAHPRSADTLTSPDSGAAWFRARWSPKGGVRVAHGTMANRPAGSALIRAGDLTTIPNIVSLSRIVGVVVCVSLYLTGHGWAGVGIGTVACLTDHLDGYLARRLSQETALGAMLDQVADSFTTALALAMLVVAGGLSITFLGVFLMREFWVGTVRRYAASSGIDIPSIVLGKLATAVIYWAILLIAVAILPDIPVQYGAPLRQFALACLTVGLAMSCTAGWRYTLALTERST
jgi:cardiolipin synthase